MLVTEKCSQVNMNLFCSFILLICLVLQSNHVNDYHSACMITGGIFIYTDGISKSFDGQKEQGRRGSIQHHIWPYNPRSSCNRSLYL